MCRKKPSAWEKTLVAYSLGNFLFDQKCKGCRDSCILMVDLEKGKRLRWKAVPVSLNSGRPEPFDSANAQTRRIKKALAR